MTNQPEPGATSSGLQLLLNTLVRHGFYLAAVFDGNLKLLASASAVPSSIAGNGYQREPAPFAPFLHPNDYWALRQALKSVPNASNTVTIELNLADGSGGWKRRQVHLTNLLHDPAVRGYLMTVAKVGKKERAASRLAEHQEPTPPFQPAPPQPEPAAEPLRETPAVEPQPVIVQSPETGGDQVEVEISWNRRGKPDGSDKVVVRLRGVGDEPAPAPHEPVPDWASLIQPDQAAQPGELDEPEEPDQPEYMQQWLQSPGAFRALVQNTSEAIVVVDAFGTILFHSSSVEQLFGYAENMLIGRNIFDYVHPEDLGLARAAFEEVVSQPGGVGPLIEARIRDLRGDWHWVETLATNRLRDPEVGGIVVNARDITRQKQVDEALRQTEDRFRSLVQNLMDLVVVIDADGLIQYLTPSINRLLGYTVEERLSTRFTEIVHPEDVSRIEEVFRSIEQGPGSTTRVELRLRAAADAWRYVEAVCTNLLEDESVRGIVINARDITERKSMERELTRRAFYDYLTSLPNRLLLLNRLERTLNHAARSGHPVAVLFLDLDRFKIVNDSLGHEIGDQLLIAVAQRLRRIMRPGDVVARHGGDEFIILLPTVEHPDEVSRVAERVIHELSMPYQLDRYEASISASVGIAVGKPPDVNGQDLLRNADIALYRAKEAGAGRYVIFDSSMARQAVDRLALENDLRRAVLANEFRVLYLPEVDLENGNLVGLEVLLRWMHPERGVLEPSEFMEVAEETGLIIGLGEWVLEEVCRQLSRWRTNFADTDELRVALNISAKEFHQPNLFETIAGTLNRYDLSADALRLEITESVIASDPFSALRKLHRLKNYGLRLAIDDFGTGYSSLEYLTRVAFDVLKIARVFVSGPGGVTGNLSIIRAVTSLAHALGMEVTAEGIETKEHLARVRAAGCNYGQGFLFSQALQAHAVEALLLSRQTGN